jgi:DNA-binding protein HU-beta
MNQSELIEKVARATELNQAAAGQAVKAVVNAILDSLVAGEAVRVSGLGTFNVAEQPAREGRNPLEDYGQKSHAVWSANPPDGKLCSLGAITAPPLDGKRKHTQIIVSGRFALPGIGVVL